MNSFHQELKEWSEIKHSILGNYLALFLGKLGLSGEPVYYVDGFAGAGRYEDGTQGSPLIAAEIARKPQQTSRNGILRCINVDNDPEAFANLEQETISYVAQGLVFNHLGTFQEHLNAILRQTNGHTAFFFIDPWGTEGAQFDTLQMLAHRNGKTEVLIRYDDLRVKRLYSWAKEHINSDDSKEKQTAQKWLDRVDQLTTAAGKNHLDADSPGWRTQLVKNYCAEVKNRGLFSYALYYPIRNPSTGRHKYFMTHFCNHEDGYCYMANFMALAERTVEARQRQTVDLFGGEQLSFLAIDKEFADQVESARIAQVCRVVHDIVRDNSWHGKRVQNRKIFSQMVHKLNWSATRKEWIKALRELEKSDVCRMGGSKDYEYTVFVRA